MLLTTYKISEICSIKSGKRLPQGHDFVLDEIGFNKYIRARNVKHGKITSDNLPSISEETYKIIKRYIITTGDLAVTIVANIGDVGICSDSLNGYNLTENCAKLTDFKKNVDSRYLNYYLSQPCMKEYMTNVSIGAAQAKLGISKLSRINVELPLLNAQKAIVQIISAYVDAIENNNKRIAILEKMASELYKEWFVRMRFPGYETAEYENGLPKGWRIGSIKETFNIFDTERIPLSSLDRDAQQKIYPYYGAAELMDYVEGYLFDGIYLLMGEDGSVITPEGKPILQYVWGKFWVNNHAHVLQGKKPFTTELIHLILKNTDITGIVTGSAQPKISQGRLFKKKVIIATEDVINNFCLRLRPIYITIRNFSEQNKLLTKQRDLLLPRLMSGKLEV